MSTLVPRSGDDRVMTPPALAKLIVDHFKPSGLKLDPCRGDGAFYQAMMWDENIDWCEIDEGRDFFNVQVGHKWDWIVTNPPWSQFRAFLQHSMKLADNIVFLATTNHYLALKARQRDIAEAGFGIVEVLYLDTPPLPWPQSGFSLGAGWFRRGWKGSTFHNYEHLKS